MNLDKPQNTVKQNQQPSETAEEFRLRQGEKASEIFSGKVEVGPVKKIFSDSAELFADIIRGRLTAGGDYRLADFGSYKGELLENVCKLLPGFNLHTIGIDLKNNLEENEVAQEKIISDLCDINLENKSVDLGFARYVLHWNSPEKQKQILKEIVRIIKDFTIIQHVGADNKNPETWRQKLDDLLDGEEISKLERHGHFFSSSDELEKWMAENNISFEKILEVCVNDLAETLAQRFSLNESEKQIAREMLSGSDYIMQTTWVISSNNGK